MAPEINVPAKPMDPAETDPNQPVQKPAQPEIEASPTPSIDPDGESPQPDTAQAEDGDWEARLEAARAQTPGQSEEFYLNVLRAQDAAKAEQIQRDADKKAAEEAQAERMGDAIALIKAVIQDSAENAGAPFAEDALEAFEYLQENNLVEFHRQISALGKVCRCKTELNSVLRQRKRAAQEKTAGVETHHAYALEIIHEVFTRGEWSPVAYNSDLYILNVETSIWERIEFKSLVTCAANICDNRPNCTRLSDYESIATHILQICEKPDFFTSSATNGVACLDKFYSIQKGKISVDDLSPAHRQRFRLEFEPIQGEKPKHDKFLNETFYVASTADKGYDQVILMQEIYGAVMLGLMARHQKCVMQHDPYGRAGKGANQKILSALVPVEFQCAISPFDWNDKVLCAALAGVRLNRVGELDEKKAIPATQVKNLIGEDPITARPLYKPPFSFVNEAAHILSTNHLPKTNDHSDGFFARFLMVDFPNSRTKNGLPVIAGIADDIINTEMSSIAWWALEGALRLLNNGKFTETLAHQRLLGEWRMDTNSLELFIGTECVLGKDLYVARPKFNEAYESWCEDNRMHPFSRHKCFKLMLANAKNGITNERSNGVDWWRGIKLAAN